MEGRGEASDARRTGRLPHATDSSRSALVKSEALQKIFNRIAAEHGIDDGDIDRLSDRYGRDGR